MVDTITPNALRSIGFLTDDEKAARKKEQDRLYRQNNKAWLSERDKRWRERTKDDYDYEGDA